MIHVKLAVDKSQYFFVGGSRSGDVKVFVTGVTGYIGGSVAEKLVASGHEVRGLVRPAEKEKEKIPLLKARGINPVEIPP